MTRRFLLAALLGILVPSGGASAQSIENSGTQGQGCSLHVMAALDMQTMANGLVTIPVRFEGHDHRLMVDTGGYINTVTPHLVKEEGYTVEASRSAPLKGVGTRQLNSYVEVKDFDIGQAHGKDYRFYVDTIDNLSLDGTLAPEILANYDVDFDFGHDRLNFIQSAHCPGGPVYWTKNPAVVMPMEIENRTHIHIPVTVDGKEIRATIDTGSTVSMISERAAARFLGIDTNNANLVPLKGASINGAVVPVHTYPFQVVGIGGLNVNHPTILVAPDSLWEQDDLLLGMDVLRQLHLYIAYDEKKLYVTPALAN
jgi:predicted aspartyl protease